MATRMKSGVAKVAASNDVQRAYRFTCPADGSRSTIYVDAAQVRSEALDHFATHPLPHWLPVLMGEQPLPKWLNTYDLNELPAEPTAPSSEDAARDAAFSMDTLFLAARDHLAKRQPCRCGVAATPKFEVSLELLTVSCGACARKLFVVQSISDERAA